MRILNVSNLVYGYIRATNLFFKDNLVFIEENDAFVTFDKIHKFIGIEKVDFTAQSIDKFKFNEPADIVTEISSNKTIYYGVINREEKTYSISIHKVDCDKINDDYIINIDTKVNISNNDDYNTLKFDSSIIGIDGQYAILLLRNPNHEYGQPFFTQAFLIDSLEKKSYLIPDLIGKQDTFLRTDSINTSIDGKYLILKTGRILPIEKKGIYNKQKKEMCYKPYYDSLENLIVYEVDQFIDNIKNGIEINTKKIIETCDLHSALSIIDNDEDKITYSFECFDCSSTYIKTYNLKTKQMESSIIRKSYDYIMCFDKKLYGFLKTENTTSIYDIASGRKILSTDKRVIYVDEEIFITFEYKSNDKMYQQYTLIINDLKNNNVIDTFKCTYYNFHYNKNALILF